MELISMTYSLLGIDIPSLDIHIKENSQLDGIMAQNAEQPPNRFIITFAPPDPQTGLPDRSLVRRTHVVNSPQSLKSLIREVKPILAHIPDWKPNNLTFVYGILPATENDPYEERVEFLSESDFELRGKHLQQTGSRSRYAQHLECGIWFRPKNNKRSRRDFDIPNPNNNAQNNENENKQEQEQYQELNINDNEEQNSNLNAKDKKTAILLICRDNTRDWDAKARDIRKLLTAFDLNHCIVSKWLATTAFGHAEFIDLYDGYCPVCGAEYKWGSILNAQPLIKHMSKGCGNEAQKALAKGLSGRYVQLKHKETTATVNETYALAVYDHIVKDKTYVIDAILPANYSKGTTLHCQNNKTWSYKLNFVDGDHSSRKWWKLLHASIQTVIIDALKSRLVD